MYRIWRKIKNREFLLMLLLAFGTMTGCLIAVKIEISNDIPNYATHVGHEGEEQFIYCLTDEDVIEQEFVSSQDFDMATLHFSDHDQTISGKTFISVKEKGTGTQMFYEEKSNSEIHYGDLVKLEFQGKAGVNYVLKLEFEGMGGNGLGIFGFPESGEETESYKIAIGFHTYTKRFEGLVRWILFIIFCTLLISVILVTCTELSEEYLFLGIAIPVGIAFLSFLSINVVHDGGTHLAKVYHYSNVLLGKGAQDNYSCVLLREDEAEVFNEIYEERNRENPTREIYWDTIEGFDNKKESNNWVLSHEYRETSGNSFWEYFPGVFGMTIGRIIGGSPRFNIFLAKIFFFVFYIIMVFWAIKISPNFKSVLAFGALLPMNLYQATGITYDSVVTAFSMMILALFFKARTESLSRKEVLILFGCSAFLGCCKGGFYLVLLLLFLTISKECFGNFKNKCKICIGSLVCGGIGMMITYMQVYMPVIRSLFAQMASQDRGTETNEIIVSQVVEKVPETQISAYGISYVVKNSADFIKMFGKTLIQKADQYLGSLIGYRMAWSDMLIDWIIIFTFLVLLLLASSDTEEIQCKVTVLERCFLLVCLGVEVIGFHILMLIETPMSSSVIEGVQGRYFLAWVPIVILIFHNGKRKYEKNGFRRLFCYYAIAESIYLYSFLKIFLAIE